MAVSIVCRGCGADVPGGRLTCPECGEMLASVAGAQPRTPSTLAPAAVRGAPAMAAPAPAVPSAPSNATPAVPPMAAPEGPAWTVAPDPVAAPASFAPSAPGPSDSAASLTLFPSAGSAAFNDGDPDAGSDDADLDPRALATPPDLPTRPTVEPTWPTGPRPVPVAATPGAYVPPVLQPAGPVAPARAWAGHAPDAPGTLATGGVAGSSQAATADGAMGASAGAVASGPRLAGSIDPARATEFVGWLAIAGGALAAVGFLLPWSVSVIGASGVGYFDRWGLAGPGHLLIVAALLGVVAAAALRDRVPVWLGIGLPGLGLGALLVGLVWPYLFGPLGAQLGVTVVALGSIMLAAAGAAAIVVDRHERAPRVV